jgi:hypothetical protein
MVATLFTPSAGTLNADDTNASTSFRMVCTPSIASNGSLQVTFQAASATGLTIGHASFGKWAGTASADTTATPIELKFTGASGFTIAANATKTSDLTAHPGFTLTTSDKVVVIFDTTSPGGTRLRGSNANVDMWYNAGSSSWNLQNPPTHTKSAGTDYGIVKIETNDAAGGGSGKAKVWSGSAWVEKPAKVWSGSAWVQKPVKTWTGSAWKTVGSAGPTGPTGKLITSFAPGSGRDDFTGEVGVRINIATTFTASWIGIQYGGGVATGYKVNLYEWFADSLQRTVTIDLTGKALGEWGWAPIAPITFTGGGAGYYALMLETVAGAGKTWANEGPVTMSSQIGNIYATYRAGTMSVTSAGSSYVGLDLGW